MLVLELSGRHYGQIDFVITENALYVYGKSSIENRLTVKDKLLSL